MSDFQNQEIDICQEGSHCMEEHADAPLAHETLITEGTECEPTPPSQSQYLVVGTWTEAKPLISLAGP